MADVYVNDLFGKRIDLERLTERLKQVSDPERVAKGEVVLALVVEQLLERIETLEARVLEKPDPAKKDADAFVSGGPEAIGDTEWEKRHPGGKLCSNPFCRCKE